MIPLQAYAKVKEFGAPQMGPVSGNQSWWWPSCPEAREEGLCAQSPARSLHPLVSAAAPARVSASRINAPDANGHRPRTGHALYIHQLWHLEIPMELLSAPLPPYKDSRAAEGWRGWPNNTQWHTQLCTLGYHSLPV